MRVSRSAVLALLLASCCQNVPAAGKTCPFPYQRVQLPNGFRAYLIKTGAGGQIAYVTVVRTGAREEYEPGRTGFAHFFEHMMFRGTKKYTDYDAITTKIGAARNASTSNDVFEKYHATDCTELVLEGMGDPGDALAEGAALIQVRL